MNSLGKLKNSLVSLVSILAIILPFLTGCTLLTNRGIVLNVKDFGAIGDGVIDDSKAFKDALKKAAGIKGLVTIRVPDGTYKLTLPEDSTTSAQLLIEKMSDLTIAGDESVLLLFGNPYHNGIGIINSKNIIVKNLAVDFDPLPYTQGTIAHVVPDQKLIDIRVDKGFPLPTAAQIDAFSGKKGGRNVGYVYDPVTRIKLNQYFDQYLRKQVKQLDNGLYRYQSCNEVKKDMVGKKFAVVGRRRGSAVMMNGNNNCLLENVEVYSSPSTAYYVSRSSRITIDKCAIKQKPGTNRLMSSNADGLYCNWCPVGPTLSNSFFTGMGDDSVNICGSYMPVLNQIDDHTIIVESHGSLFQSPLDLVGVDLDTHAHFSYGPVVEVRGTPKVKGYRKPCLKITFKNKLPKLVTWKQSGNSHKCSQVLNLNACGRRAKIINNHFYNHRCRGVLMRSPNSIIKGNHFDTLAGPGICVSNDGGFLIEGPSGNGTVIEDNSFTNIERSNICIYSSYPKKDHLATKGVVNVKIINNRFDNYGGDNAYGRGVVGNVLYIKNADNLLIEGNKIGKPLDPKLDVAPIILGTNGRITWKNNTIQGRPLDLKKDVHIIQ